MRTGNLLFLSGMLPTVKTKGRGARFVWRAGAVPDAGASREAAHLAALNALAVARADTKVSTDTIV